MIMGTHIAGARHSKKNYIAGGKRFEALIDWEEQTVRITAAGFNRTFAQSEYENFEGSMMDFGLAALEGKLDVKGT